jgi:hypothetical protein
MQTPSVLQVPSPQESAVSHPIETPAPKATAEEVALLVKLARLQPTPAQFEEIVEAYGFIQEMTARLHTNFDFGEEPAHVFTPIKF